MIAFTIDTPGHFMDTEHNTKPQDDMQYAEARMGIHSCQPSEAQHHQNSI
jgi:hypothetical protein